MQANSDEFSDQELIAFVEGGAFPEAAGKLLIDRHHQDIVNNTSPISPVDPAGPCVSQIEEMPQTQAEQTNRIVWDDFPELDSKYGVPSSSEDSEDLDSTLTSLLKPLTGWTGKSGKENTPACDIPHSPYSFRQNTDFLSTGLRLCTRPCLVQTQRNQGAYLQHGQVLRVWKARWGYPNLPWEIWEAWLRIEQGRGRTLDQVEVDGFALSHWSAGP